MEFEKEIEQTFIKLCEDSNILVLETNSRKVG